MATARKAEAAAEKSPPQKPTRVLNADRSQAIVTRENNPVDQRPGFPLPPEKHPKAKRSKKLPKMFSTESAATTDSRRVPSTAKRESTVASSSSPQRTALGAVKQPPRKKTGRLTPEESAAQMREFLKAKQARDRQQPS